MSSNASASGNTTYNNISVGLTNDRRQFPWIIRALYFLLIGWWLVGVWLSVAYCLILLIITIPVAQWMLNTATGVATLQRR